MAEGSRLLSGYRVKSPVPGSNPGLSAALRTLEGCRLDALTVFPKALYCPGRAPPRRWLSLPFICGNILLSTQ